MAQTITPKARKCYLVTTRVGDTVVERVVLEDDDLDYAKATALDLVDVYEGFEHSEIKGDVVSTVEELELY